MAKYYGDICASVGEKEDGKKRWHKVGACFIDDDKNISLKLDSLPLPKMDNNGYPACWLKIFKSQQSNQGQQSQYNQNNYAQQSNQGQYTNTNNYQQQQTQSQQQQNQVNQQQPEDDIPF